MKKLDMARYALFLPALLLATHAAWSETYHVSPKGDDAAPGAFSTPWKSIEKINKTDFQPGDQILFEGGCTYPGAIRLDGLDTGMPGNPVTISSYGDGRATIDAGNDTGLKADGCDSLVVKNINFKGSGRKQGSNGSGVDIQNCIGSSIDQVEAQGFRLCGVTVQGVRDMRITHVYAHDNGAAGIGVGDQWSTNVYIGYCVAENNPGDPLNLDNHSGNGIVVGSVRGCIIEYCEAMNNGWDMPREGNGPVGIWAWNADRVTIQFCISHDNKSPSWDGGGFDLDGGVTNSVMQYNLSYNNIGPGYFMCMYWPSPVWKNNIIRYNISQNDGLKNEQCGGIRINWMEGMSDAQVYNNTVYNKFGPAIDITGDQAPGFVFRNNILVGAKRLISGDAFKVRFEGNLYWLLDGGKFSVDGYDSLEAWSAATGQERVNGVLVGQWAAPRLVRMGKASCTKPTDLAALKEYHLKHGSSCIGAGVPIEDNGGRDFWGNPVAKEGKPTIGAHEPGASR